MQNNVNEDELCAKSVRANLPSRLDLPVYESLFLLSGKTEALIIHAGKEYRLKLTRQGKLILTK